MAADFMLTELLPADEIHRIERHQMEIIGSAANYMRRLIDDLLDATMLDAGRLHVTLSALPVGALLDEARGILQPMAAAKSAPAAGSPRL